MGIFKKINFGLRKTRNNMSGAISVVFRTAFCRISDAQADRFQQIRQGRTQMERTGKYRFNGHAAAAFETFSGQHLFGSAAGGGISHASGIENIR